MKKALYIILLVAGLVAGVGFLTLIAGGAVGWTYFLIVTAVWGAVMVLMLVKLKKADDEKKKRAIKIAIPLVMLIPFVSSLFGRTWFVITMMRAVW